MENKKNEWSNFRKDMVAAMGLGIELAVAVFLGAFIGYKLDGYFRSSPWLMVGGVILGSMVGFWNAYKLVIKEEKKEK